VKTLNKQPFIFIWHHPDDIHHVTDIAGILSEHKFGFHYPNPGEPSGEFSFDTVDWWLAQSDCVIFLLSEAALASPPLLEDIKKVIRQNRYMIIPVVLDEFAAKNLPVLLKFLPGIDFRHPDEDTKTKLVEKVYAKIRQQEMQSNQVFLLLRQPHCWVVEHFRTYLIQRTLTFCWQITVENLIVSLTVTGLIQLFYHTPTRTNLASMSAASFLWMVVIIGPIIETILLQALPVFVSRKIGLNFFGQILFSLVPFALLHFSRSVGTGIGAGIIGGFYSAFTYVHWRGDSFWTAFWVTALSHGLHNFALFAMLIGEF